jgi:hypothetical protein
LMYNSVGQPWASGERPIKPGDSWFLPKLAAVRPGARLPTV